jgi:hypothetical protein
MMGDLLFLAKFFYCLYPVYFEGVHSCREMEKLCEFDTIYLIILYGLKPYFSIFKRFLEEIDLNGVESLFIGHY